MLQQTTVKAVAPRYAAFLRRWPSVAALAQAELGEVLAAWAGLGYYARARNLHACARELVARHGGKFPTTEADLRALPGIGAYSAAAIGAIAFGLRATPIDGNVERVVARLFALTVPLPAAKPEIKALAETLTPAERPGDFAQALMDLGATLCTPRAPACGLCPLRPDVPRLCARSRRAPALSPGATGASDAPRHRLRRHPRRRRRAATHAAFARPPRRHARAALLALERGRRWRARSGRARADRGGVAARAGTRRAYLHPFSSRA